MFHYSNLISLDMLLIYSLNSFWGNLIHNQQHQMRKGFAIMATTEMQIELIGSLRPRCCTYLVVFLCIFYLRLHVRRWFKGFNKVNPLTLNVFIVRVNIKSVCRNLVHYKRNLLAIAYPKMFLGSYKRACTLLFHVVAIHFTVDRKCV